MIAFLATTSAPALPDNWLATFRELLHHYLPPMENTPLVNVISLSVALAGAFLVFRSWKFERSVVCVFALMVGAWIGSRLSAIVGTPGPISAAVAAILLTFLAYRTYKWWLAGGSVVLLFFAALVFQLGQGDLHRYLPTIEDGTLQVEGDMIGPLTSAEEQLKKLHPDWRDQVDRIKTRLMDEVKALGPARWLLPVAAAILGGILAYWALRAFSVVWLGFLGANMAVFGISAFLCAHWPEVRERLIDEPRFPAGAVVGLWLLGLLLQAKEARFPKSKPAEGAKSKAKS